jgi:predicted RNA binding protein YcfA (HicA-like mRNA interferase family)
MNYPKGLSADDLIKVLKKYHYQISRQKGSHIRLTTTINGEHHITIPNHSSLKIGTLSSIIKEVALYLGKTKEDVIKELFS